MLVTITIDSQSGFTTKDYRDAISGEGPLAYTWSDKPHRLLFDLINFIEFNGLRVKPMAGEIEHLAGQEMAGIMGAISVDTQQMREVNRQIEEAYAKGDVYW